MKFENNEEKLKHIGLMCCAHLHDAFANMARIKSLCCNNKDGNLTDKKKLALINKMADETYELCRVIERYRHQEEKAEMKTFLASDLGKMLLKYFGREELELNIINDFSITCKKTLLLQSLLNLIDNAYKHNTNDYKNKKVLITIVDNKIVVSDNGSGIPEENKSKIFDLFFTTKDLDKMSGEHNGIGLYGVKQHIDSLGYSIKVVNGFPMSGANFTIRIK